METRPAITTKELEQLLQRLKPHLEKGMSLRESCLMEQIPISNLYYWQEKHPWILEQIEVYKNTSKVIINSFFHNEIIRVFNKHQKVLRYNELKKKSKGSLTTDEKQFIKELIDDKDYYMKSDEMETMRWYASNNKNTREDWSATKIQINNQNNQQNNLQPADNSELTEILQDVQKDIKLSNELSSRNSDNISNDTRTGKESGSS